MSGIDLARNCLRRSYAPVIARKMVLRTRSRRERRDRIAAEKWAEELAEDMDAWGRELDDTLWSEAVSVAAQLRETSKPRLAQLAASGIELGGAGACELLYFLVRLRRPENILETGVAAGWSTTALLTAIRDNGRGHLYSSDFPYFRLRDPEKYIGYLVPDQLRDHWTLFVKGDRRNLQTILQPGRTFALVHYDSDKTTAGRKFFMQRIAEHISSETVVVMDDISDNRFFCEYVAGATPQYVRVFRYGGKYIGLFQRQGGPL